MIIHARNFITPDSALGGWQMKRSIRLEGQEGGGAYFSRTAGSETGGGKYSYSGWVKRTMIGQQCCLWGGGGGSQTNTHAEGFYISGQDQLALVYRGGVNGAGGWYAYATAKIRDVTSWMHIVITYDSNQSGISARNKYYLNGVQLTDVSGGYLGNLSDLEFTNKSGVTQYIGRMDQGSGPGHARAYYAETHVADGYIWTPSDFGYTDAQTGQWRPKRPEDISVNYGNNGFYLDYSDNSSTSTLGVDRSGNGNNWSANSFSVSSGADNDSVTDTPTNNFCTMNMTDKDGSVTVTDGNLKVSNNNQVWAGVKGTLAVNSGKWYYEMKTGDANIFCGWASDDLDTFIAGPQDSNDVMSAGSLVFCDNGKIHLDTGGSENRVNYSSSLSANDVLGCAIDLDNNTAQFYKNGTGLGSIDISSSKLAVKHVHPYFISYYTNQNYTFNFGQQPFAHTPPTGYRAMSSKNIATPIPAGVVRPQRFFDTVLYTGNGGTKSINTLEFKPDMIWFKTRDDNRNHVITDSVRGRAKGSYPDDSQGEFSDGSSNGLVSFDLNGFTLGAPGGASSHNKNGQTIVAWCWKAGGAAVSNTDGSITSQVSANTQSGFSVITYTGTGSVATVGHGLGKVPKWFIIKRRDSSANWQIYHDALGNTHNLYFTSGSKNDDNNAYNDTSPTSSVFTIGTSTSMNANGGTYVAYCWSEIPGYSKFGSYTGNGGSDGTYVDCGFKPAWVMLKSSNLSVSWYMLDNKRNTVNPESKYLKADSNSTEDDDEFLDFLSNGFKHRYGDSSGNGSNDSYIYMAFAETPSGTMFGLDANAR